MHLLSSTIISAGVLAGHLVHAASDEDTAPSKFVHLSFDKLYGSSYETASKRNRPQARLRKRTNGYEEIEIINEQSFYSVELEIGTPNQNVTVLIDTGSSDLWVTGPDNPYCLPLSGNQDDSSPFGWFTRTTLSGSATATTSSSSLATIDCSEYGVFNSSRSSSFRSNNTAFRISYGDGTFAAGTWGTDTLNLGDLNVTSLSFAVANSSNSSVGVFGIGLPGLQTTYTGVTAAAAGTRPYQYQNFPMVLKAQGAIHQNAYSLFLNEPDADSGSILFGAVDHSKYSGQLYTIPLLNPYQSRGIQNPIEFDITVQGVGVSKDNSVKTVTTTQFPALLDSGTTLTYLPYSLTELIADRIGAHYSLTRGFYTLPCPDDNDDTQILFDFGGFQIATNLSNYILGDSTGSSTCYLGMIPLSGNSAIFGDNFLIHAYVVYDLENYEISMAQAQFNDSESRIEVITDGIPSATRAPGYSATWSTSQSISSGGNAFSATTTKRNVGEKLAPTPVFVFLASIFSFLI